MQTNIRPVPAPTLTNLAASPSVRTVVLTWDKPTDTTYAGAEIWSASSSTLGSATKIGTVTGNTFTDSTSSVNPVSNRYYWVRAINVYGRTDGAWSNMATAKSLLNTNLDIAAGAVQASNLSVAAIDSTTGDLKARYITSYMIQAGAITANEIAANTITAAQIWTGYVYTNTLNASQITAGQMSADRLDVTNLRVGAPNLTITPGGDNLISNSGFEVQNTSTPSCPNGFIMYNNGNVSAAYIGVTGRTGGKAMGIRALAATTNTFGIRTSNNIVEADGTIGGVRGGWQYGKTYVISFKARKVNGANMKAIALRWNYGPANTVVLADPVLSTDWQKYSFRITWGAAGTNIEPAGQLYIDCNWTESGASIAANDEFHVDELIVQEGDVGDEWFPSSFEAKNLALNAAISAFTPYKTYDFNGSTQGWVGPNSTNVTASADYITVAATNNDPMLASGVSFPGSKYNKIRMRFRRTAGSAWDGSLFYANANHGEDGAYAKGIPDPTIGQGSNWVVAEWDMSTSTNPSDWASSIVNHMRIDLGASASDVFDVDWIAIGRYGVGSDEASKDVMLTSRGNILLTGNTATKTSGSNAWDSDVYSLDSYTGGAYASAVLPDTTSQLMFGLNDDPTTDSSYISLTYALYFEAATNLVYVWENNTNKGSYGGWAAGDIFMVVYDGSSVKYLKNGAVFYTSTIGNAPNQQLFFDSSFCNVGSSLKNIRFGPQSSNNWVSIGGPNKAADNATADLVLMGRGVAVTGNNAVKTQNTVAWDADVYSQDSFTGGAFASAVAVSTVGHVMFGLNDDPVYNASYNSINYAIYLDSGTLEVYEGGVFAYTYGAYSAGDVFAVVYDGSSVKYYRNGNLFFTSGAPAANTPNQRLYFDSSFYDTSSALKNMRFGPMSSNNWSNVGGTNKPADNAGAGSVINFDPNFTTASEWEVTTNTGGGGPNFNYTTTATGAGAPTCVYPDNNVGTTDAGVWILGTRRYPINPGRTYRMSGNIYASASNGRTFYLGVVFYSADGNTIANNGWGGSWSGYPYAGQAAGNQFTKYSGEFGSGTSKPIPPNAVACRVGVILNYGTSGNSGDRMAAQLLQLSDITEGATFGLNVYGQITSGNAAAYISTAAIQSAMINDLRTANYTEDGSGNPTAGAKLSSSSSVTALKVSKNNLQVGTQIFSDYWFRLMQGIDGNMANGRVIWRGNNDATTRGGAPNIACLSVTPVASQVLNSNFQQIYHNFTITPTSYNAYSDNLDAMQQLHVQLFASTGSSSPFVEFYWPCPSRNYDAASGIARGSWSYGWRFAGAGALPGVTQQYETNGVFTGVMRVRYANSYGWSVTKDFAAGVSNGTALGTTTIGATPPASGGSGGTSYGGGGGCPAPWVKVMLVNGVEINAGDLHEGAVVAAVDDTTLKTIKKGGTVRDLVRVWAMRYRVTLADGRATEWSENHRFAVEGRDWVQVQHLRPGDRILGQQESIVSTVLAVGRGQVVSFRVEGAGTYFSGGLLCHNMKTFD